MSINDYELEYYRSNISGAYSGIKTTLDTLDKLFYQHPWPSGYTDHVVYWEIRIAGRFHKLELKLTPKTRDHTQYELSFYKESGELDAPIIKYEKLASHKFTHLLRGDWCTVDIFPPTLSMFGFVRRE